MLRGVESLPDLDTAINDRMDHDAFTTVSGCYYGLGGGSKERGLTTWERLKGILLYFPSLAQSLH